MNVDNFIVRPKRRLVEKYATSQAWLSLSEEDLNELSVEIAGLPSQLEGEAEEIKRFDILILKLQLAILHTQPSYERLQEQVQSIAGLLEEKASIPLVREQLSLILEVQTDQWWQDVTLPMLEVLRKKLRGLVKLIEKQKRKIIYTDFEDKMTPQTEVPLGDLTPLDNFEKFKAKVRFFLVAHQDDLVISKLRKNKQLTPSDLLELERILLDNKIGRTEDIERAKEEAKGLGLFVRSLLGLERDIAKQEMGKFIAGKQLNSNQIEFVDMIVDHLTQNGIMDAGLLYDHPFTDITDKGPTGLFTHSEISQLVSLLDEVTTRAVA